MLHPQRSATQRERVRTLVPLVLRPAVAAVEAVDTTTRVDQLLLAREERVALVAQLGAKLGLGRAGREGVAARAVTVASS